MLAAGLLVVSVVKFVPKCESFDRIKGLVPAERDCTNAPALGLLLALAGLVLAAAALRVVEREREMFGDLCSSWYARQATCLVSRARGH
jgi:hypothetical protein